MIMVVYAKMVTIPADNKMKELQQPFLTCQSQYRQTHRQGKHGSAP